VGAGVLSVMFFPGLAVALKKRGSGVTTGPEQDVGDGQGRVGIDVSPSPSTDRRP
jgi:hypothetical protein